MNSPAEAAIHFKQFAYETWKAKYGVEPTWGVKHFVILANLEKLAGFPRCKAAWLAFLGDEDLFYRGHEPTIFRARFDHFVTGRPVPKPKEKRDGLSAESRAYLERFNAARAAGKTGDEARAIAEKPLDN